MFLIIGGAEKTSQKLPEASQKTQWTLLMDHIRPGPDCVDSKDVRRDTAKYVKEGIQESTIQPCVRAGPFLAGKVLMQCRGIMAAGKQTGSTRMFIPLSGLLQR